MSADIESKYEALRNDVSTLQSDHKITRATIDRFDKNLDKLTEVSTTVARLLAVHEQRLDVEERASKQLADYMEQRRTEIDTTINKVYDKIETSDSELRADMALSHKEIITEIKTIGNDLNALSIHVNTATTQVKNDIQSNLDTRMDEVDERINKIEKFIWVITGGSIVVGAVLSQLAGILHITT